MVEGKMYSTANPYGLGLKTTCPGARSAPEHPRSDVLQHLSSFLKYGFAKCNGLFFIFPIETAILGYTLVSPHL